MKLENNKLYVVKNKITGLYLDRGFCSSKIPVFLTQVKVLSAVTRIRDQRRVPWNSILTICKAADWEIQHVELVPRATEDIVDFYIKTSSHFKLKKKRVKK
jgi:hypothetical protein